MNILALEPSTHIFSLAVRRNDEVLAFSKIKNTRQLSSKIIPAIDRVLKKSGKTLKDVDAFAVGLGPGSFTGLRVGVSTVKGLAHAMSKSVMGVVSLDIAAMNVKKGQADQVCVLFDARRGMVYSAVYACLDEGIQRISDYMLAPPQDVLKILKGDVAFAGDGIALYQEEIEKDVTKKTAHYNAEFLNERQWYPSAKNLSLIARGRFVNNDFDRIDTLTPLYLYPEDCQVKK